MRHSIAAIALFEHRWQASPFWLAQWNDRWQAYHFVGGHKRRNESFRDCVIREVQEELLLSEARDFLIEVQPLAHIEFTAWSESARAQTRYTMELFPGKFTGSIGDLLSQNPQNRWLSLPEIRKGECVNGKRVSPTMGFLMGEIGYEPH